MRVDLGPAGSGQVIDISMGGVRVKSVAPLRRDGELPMRIELPDRPEPLRCFGRVVWSKPTGAAGLRFLSLAEDQKVMLAGWIAELQQAAGGTGATRDDEFTRITAQVKNMKLNNADALSLIARRATQIAGASSVAIALGKSEHMVCLARAGNAPELGTPIAAVGLTGECMRGRKLVHCLDASTDPRAGELKQGSALIVPLLVNAELRGIMQVFSDRPGAFDAKRTESLEQLADAVVFVTHNAMPRARSGDTGRLATVTQMPPRAPVSAPPISKPSDSGRMAALGSAPTVTKPSESGRMAAYTPPVVAPTPAPVSPAMAETSVEVAPLAAPVQPMTLPTPPPAPAVPKRYSVTVPATAHRPLASGSARWMLAIAAAVVLIATPIAWYFLHHKAPAATASVAPPTVSAQGVATNETVMQPTTPTVTVTPTESAVTTPPVKTTPVKDEKPVEKVEKAEKKAAVVEKAPGHDAIVLASAAPVHKPQTEEPDSPAPSAPIAGAAMPGISLPTATAAPKLVAPPQSKITGGNLVEHPSPVYPQFAVTQQIEGQVKLQVTITAQGTVENIRRVGGPPLLVGAAINAVKRWRYEPLMVDGHAVPREETITLDFKLPSRRN